MLIITYHIILFYLKENIATDFKYEILANATPSGEFFPRAKAVL